MEKYLKKQKNHSNKEETDGYKELPRCWNNEQSAV